MRSESLFNIDNKWNPTYGQSIDIENIFVTIQNSFVAKSCSNKDTKEDVHSEEKCLQKSYSKNFTNSESLSVFFFYKIGK